MILGLDEHVLRFGKILEGGTRPITMIGSNVEHKARGKAEALQGAEEHPRAIIRPALVTQTAKPQPEGPKKRLNQSFHVRNPLTY